MKDYTKGFLTAVAIYAVINIVAFIYLSRKNVAPSNGDLVVYGSMDCGYTVKQLDHLKAKGIKHRFVDCNKDKCPEHVKGFPTMQKPSGEIIVGYTEF